MKSIKPKFTFRRLAALTATLVVATVTYQNCGQGYKIASGTKLASSDLKFMPKEIIVKMNTTAAHENLKAWALASGFTLNSEWADQTTSHWSWVAEMDVSQVQDLFADKFMADVEFSEPNYLFALPNPATLDISSLMQYSDVQTAMANNTSSFGLTAAPIGGSEARQQLTPGKSSVIVAVLDSGIDLQHDVFKSGALWKNTREVANNGIDDDQNGLIDDIYGWNFADNDANVQDVNGHGTHCAGIILGTGQDIFKRPLDTPKVKIMPLKFMNLDGNGSTSAAVSAIYYAVKNGARVISNSWGGPTYSRTLEEAIMYAYEHNVSVVAAAGNSTNDNDTHPTFPASYQVPQIISVAATTDTDNLATFSNYGIESVDLGAPGVKILSTYPSNKYTYLSGTSMATPFVAGVAALMIYERPDASGYELKNLILENSDKASLGGKVMLDHRLNALKAVNAVKTASFTGMQPVYSVNRFDNGEAVAAGCGAIKSSDKNFPGGNNFAAIITLLLLPMLTILLSYRRTMNFIS